MRNNFIYADHAGTTRLCDAAWTEMKPFFYEKFANPSSLYSYAKTPREAVGVARTTIAMCIGADPEEIVFTSGGTESDNWVLKGTSGGIMVSAYEHHAVLNAAANEAFFGREVVYVSPKACGQLMPETLARKWTAGIKLVSIMMANNEIGTINPISLLAQFAHGRSALFHTDAVQAVGHVPIDVHEMGVDFLSASAHKFNGPKGIGFLYIRKGVCLKQLIHGGQQEFSLRAGTENVPYIVAMAAALKWNCEHMQVHTAHLTALTDYFKSALLELLPNAYFPGTGSDEQLPGLVSVSLPGYPAESLTHLLDLKGIAVSTGAACDSRRTQVSHVLRAIRLPMSLAKCTIRFSFGAENTKKEIDSILEALKVILRRYKSPKQMALRKQRKI